MGGSLARALRQAYPRMTIYGLDRNRETVRQAARAGVINAGSTTWDSFPGADFLILALPVRAIMCFLQEIGPTLAPGTLVMDLGSTKRDICRALRTLPAGVEAMGGHPMCGKEQAGWEASEETLFHHTTFVLCPLERTTPWALSVARELITTVGARPLRLTAARHDRLVATISHLPYLAASALLATADKVGREDPLLWEVAANGFRDTSRLASSNVTMSIDILLTNIEPVLALLEQYEDALEQLKSALQSGNEEALRSLLNAIRLRRNWYVERQQFMRGLEDWQDSSEERS